jgi:Trypsin Inhibitor like cysteine rich domain
MKLIILLISAVTLVIASITPGPLCPADRPNETNDPCGRPCELSCDNIGVEEILDLRASSLCGRGCWCKQGSIRDEDGNCVLQRRSSCGKIEITSLILKINKKSDNSLTFSSTDDDPCEGIPHTLWTRCVGYTSERTCYQKRCPPIWTLKQKCACKPGYAKNLKNQCIKMSSPECKRLAKKVACIESDKE